ncbi:obscurin isoform X3 [Zerene cesonia]|uniref:obscurin isoform X3 n=1 Tax=Zerene cesonia TaxID=33412 RepID=UPI0018E55115|nr:obscurin isoform X3 [Zerene cesonia]
MSFCRITGRSRGLPKPNYFPLLAPISPADAKRCCRITGKSYGLPSHHYIPVLLISRSSKTKCKITNVSGELGPHHYSPEINYGNRKHDIIPDYRYIFPVLDGSTDAQKALIELLSMKQVTEEKKYVYTVDERRCSLVFSARMEAAVRDGDVRDVMLAKDSDTVLIKTKQGRSVSMDFKDFTEDVEMFEGEGPNAEVLKQREMEELEERKKKRKRAAGLSSMKKIFENKEKLAEVQEIEEEKLRQDRLAKKAKLEVRHEKHDVKSFSNNNFDVEHMRSKSSIIMCSGDWKDQVHPIIESWDCDLIDKNSSDNKYTPKVTTLPTPVKITPYHCEAEIFQADNNIGETSIPLENVPCVNPLKPIKSRPSEEVLNAVKQMSSERLIDTANVTEKMLQTNKMDMIPTFEELPDIVKNIKKGKREKVAKISGLTLDINKARKFVPGQHVNTPQGPVFVPGQTVETPAGPVFVPGLSVNTPLGASLIPGHIVANENNNEPIFLAGQVMNTADGEQFVCGQTVKNKDDTYRFIEGQTVLSEDGFKFVPGKVVNTGSDEVFVPGQTISTPDGIQFIPGQTITENGNTIFTPGQNAKIENEWQFIPGQVVHQDDELHFVPGATLATPNGLKFIPGQTVAINGETCFVPGITKMENSELKFVPGTTVETINGPKFIEGQIVQTTYGEKFVPGTTIIQANGHVEFSVAKSMEDVQFSDSAPVGLPIDIKTCSVSEESLYVFGHMIQTTNGIEFYPGSRVPKNDGKIVPGRLVKNEAGESRFVPGTMVEGIFVPGQIVFTENGEQFVPGQVVDTSDGPKFVPGQVVNTKSGPKFVPGQTIHTIDGPRFVPGQIIETKAGPTFIPGQVISTDEGSRFVPGQVVDTEEGPRFVPGRVIETDDNGVTFVPGQIVQTPEGLKFVAPDLVEGEEGLEFSVQSFLVTPEELKLLKVKTNPNDTTSTKGELTIDTNMLRQLSEAGMSIGRQVPAELPAINVILNETKNAEALKEFVSDFGLKDTVANQLMDVIKSIIEMSGHVKSEIHQNQNGVRNFNKTGKLQKSRSHEKLNGEQIVSEEKIHEEHIKNSIAAAVLAALVTAEQFEEINNNNGKEKYQHILKSIDTILGKSIDEDFVTAMYHILQKEDEKGILCEEILENTTQPKVELIKIAVNSTLSKHSLTETEIIEKFSDFLKSENEVLGPAFKNITKNDSNLLQHVLGRISDSISFIKTDQDAAESLQKAIVSAVQESSAGELQNMLQNTDKKDLKELILQSIGLARVLGMSDVAKSLLSLVNDELSLSKIEGDETSMNILKRLTVMRKLAEQTPDLHATLEKLEKNPELARSDPKMRELVRESAALMIIPEESPLMTSDDVPLSLLQPENSLAMEEFLFQRKKCPGALLIMKRGLQAVVPREASRAVLTGEVAYSVLDENGIRHFEPLHVFSALNLSKPIAHRFSMYSCPIADEKDDDLQNINGYCNISNSQIITRLGGWGRRYSGVNMDKENRSRYNTYDNTPSYKRYPSRSSTRSRSSCSKSPPKVDDVVVASSDYTAAADDEVSVKAGDIVEILDTKAALGSKSRLASELDVDVVLLDSTAAKHKIAVRPKKNHPKVKVIPKQNGERWLVRVVDDVEDEQLRTRQGYVPAHVLRERPERDATALAARRQAVVRELIETEEEFGRDMQQVVSQYMRPMDKATTPKAVFDSREFLFSNFKQICEFHNTTLLEGIKYYAGDPRMLGRALLRMEREFDKHVAYCRDEPKAQKLLSIHPVVKKYFQDIAKKVGDDKGLPEHLKLPIQRINDYQLLLKELVKYSKRLGDDCTDLQKALELFLGVPNRATNNLFIASIEGYRGNIYKLGRLLTHDWFTVEIEGRSKERYLFLFKARILVCKIKRVADDRSVFVLQNIVKLPDLEIQDHPDTLKFELHQKNPPLVITLTAHKDSVKTAWLREIRQYASDLVALAEHAADDLQVLPQEEYFEAEEESKKREYSEDEEDDQKEKKLRTEEAAVEDLQQESLQVTTKRKASLECEVAQKISKSENAEVASISEIHEITSTQEVAADLESKSIVTQASTTISESQSITSQIETGQTAQASGENVEVGIHEVSVSKQVSTTQSVQVHCTEVSTQGSVEEVVETTCKTQISQENTETNQNNLITESQQSAKEVESVSVKQSHELEESVCENLNTQQISPVPAETSETSKETSVHRTEKSETALITTVGEFRTEAEKSQELEKSASKNKQTSESFKAENKEASVSLNRQTSLVVQGEQKDSTELTSTSKDLASDKKEVKRGSKTKRSSKKKSDTKAQESKTVEQIEVEAVSKVTAEVVNVKTTETSVQENKAEESLETTENNNNNKEVVELESKKSVLEANTESKQSEDTVLEESQTVNQEESAEGEMSRYSRTSRLSGEYSSSTRKSSTGGRYESSADGGISSYSSRRESGSRIESSRYDIGGIEGSAASKYESKYSTSSAIEGGSKYGVESSYESRSSIKDGSKYGIESSYESRSSIRDGSKYGTESGYERTNSIKDGSNYGVESSYESRRSIKGGSKYDVDSYDSRSSVKDSSKYAIEFNYERSNSIKDSKYSIETTDTDSKINNIAAKYGLNNNIETSESKSIKQSIEASYDVDLDAPSKIDSIASKYGRNSITSSSNVEARSTRLNIETSFDGSNLEAEAVAESKYSKRSSKNGESVYESEYSKKALSNGSVTNEFESQKSVSKSESFDGKPIFSKTLEGQNIEPGENAMFECKISSLEEVKVTWLKDNKPLTDRLMDRVNIVNTGDVHRLEVKHCREDDTGLYTARAENVKGNAHCTAQLIVHELTPEERKQKNAQNAPYFLVALKDTEILLNTYLRFMVKVKGTPNPDVKFYREGKEIITSSDSDRVSIVRTRAEKGCYELVIADVNAADAGTYSCKAINIYGEVESEATVTVVDDKNIFGELLPGGEGLLAKGEKPVFAWKRDGLEFDPEERFKVLLGDDEDSLALVFQHVKPEDAGLYTCVAKTSTGNISCSAELTVQGAVNYLHREPQKPSLEIEHREPVVSSGGSAMLEVVCKGYPKPTVVFKHKGEVVEADARHKFLHEDDENLSLVIKNVTVADSGVYEVTASNDLGDDTTTFNLVVTAPPKIKKKIENQTCMVKSTHTVRIEVEGTPSPDVSFYKDGVLITSSERIVITKESEEVYTITIKDAKLTDTGSYSVVAKNEVNQCSDFWQWLVTSPPKVTKKLGSSKVCDEKETVTFEIQTEAEPAPTVTWFKNKTELKESSAIKISSSGEAHKLVITSAARADAGEYSCEVRNVHGSSGDACALNVRCAPQFTRRLEPRTASEGDVDVEFTVDVDAYPEPKVQWYLGDVEITEKKTVYSRVDNGSTHKLILKEVSAEMSGQYTCKVSNELGADSCQATFTVNRKPRITKSLVDMTVDEGQTLKLEVEVEGCPEPRVKWYKDGKEVTTDARIKIERDTQRLENYNLTVTLIKEEDGGEYEVRAENEMGSVSSKSTVTVHSRVFETVTTFKSGDDGSIIVSKVSSTRSHGAIITGPAETRTLHKMTSTSIHFEECDDDEYDRKIILPNTPHTTSLEVEEIASHSYYLSELGYYTIPDHVRRGIYGLIEEPQTDSDADSNPRIGRSSRNRTISIRSVSEDDMSWQNDSLSREISIEDLSKSIFEIDETKKVFSKDSYVRQTSFKEDYFTNEGEEESVILKEKSEKVFENDVTEKLIHISREFEANEYMKFDTKRDDIKNRLLEELVMEPMQSFDNITKNVAETTVERRKKGSSLFSVAEEDDGDIEDLLKRSQRQRSILDEIINTEDVKASPTLKESSMKDGHTYESLPLVYTVQAAGTPKPTVRWLHDGNEVKPDSRVHITNEGDVYKLEIDAVDLKDVGKWQCEISNKLGKQVLDAQLAVSPVAEYRKPIFKQPLEAQRVMQREPVTLQAVCTADPLPHVAWLLNGNVIVPDATVTTSSDSKELEHGLKECTFTLHIPTGRHQDTGEYTIQAKNQYGVGECSARLDILLRPEIEPLKDITTVPYEETTFITKIKANPIAEVKWSKDGYVIQPTSNIEISQDLPSETYSLTIKKVGVTDAGVYTITAKNEIGESAQQAKLTVHTNEPVFTKPLQKQTVKDYDDLTLAVRCDGVPKPQVKWYREGTELANDERRTITTEVGGQVDSELEIKHFSAADAGKYKVVAMNLSGEATTEAMVSLAQLAPGFVHKLDRQREVDEGEPLELKAKVDGSPIPTATWYKDGVKLPANEHVKQTALPDGTVKLSIERVTPADCGAYKLVITNPNGEHSALCAVAVNPTPRKPSFSQELEDVKVVVGQPVKLEARVMAFPAPEVKWFKDGLPIRPSQAVNFINQPGGIIGLAIEAARPEDAGQYSLTLSNKLGDAASKATVEVGQKERKPAFIAELMPAEVIEGFPVKMEVKVLGHPPPVIKWTHNGKEIVPDGERVRVISQPDGTHALLLSKATAQDGGKYGVIAINDKGETVSNAELSVASRTDETRPEERAQFVQALREATGDEGAPLALSAAFRGNPAPDVCWTKDGQPLQPGERLLVTCDGKRVGLEINPLKLSDAGVYAVKIVNPLGEDKTEGKVNVRKVYQPPAFTQKFTDLQQLPTFDAKFPARISGIPSPEVTWYKNGVELSPSNKYSMKRDGDMWCLYVRDLAADDAGQYKCVARNREGQAECEAALEVVDKISRREKAEAPSFLKKIGDVEVFRGLSAKFTACATGSPDPDVEWFRNGDKLFPCERIRMDKESTGLLRLSISGVEPADVGTYRCRIYNPHGEADCTAQLTYDTLEPQSGKKPLSDQYSEFDKMKQTGVPMPLSDKPIISRMADRHLTLSWRPSIPHRPRFPVTYQVEMCEVPDGDWFTARTGLRSCVCDIRNLEPFRDYKFRVRVENKYGVSDPSPYAITHRAKLEPDPPKFIPYLEPGIDFRPETSPYFPKDFDIERPPHDGYAQAPKFLRQEYDSQYGVKGHNVNLFWFVYGYPKPKMTYYFDDQLIEGGGRYDWSYTRNGQATLFINKMLERDVGWYEAVASNEHGEARQRVRLELAEYPTFIRRPEEAVVLLRKTVRLEARVTGQPYPEIKWYKDWQPLAPSSRIKMQFIEPDTVILVIHDAILKDEGLYSVSARNVAGSVSSSAMLHVEECEHEYSSRIREHPPRIKASSKPFGDFYDLGDELGRGVQGVVYHAAERLTGRNYAAKIMHGHSELKPFMRNELDILNQLNDRHLVRLHDAFEHEHTLALVTELAAGGELVRDRLLRQPGYSEREVAGYVRQLLRGLKHMHDNSFAHLGLTIGELLLSHAGSDELKICDFGLSRRIHLNQHAALNYGMPEFVAPEVASGEGVAFPADMWSVGIITYILLSGRSPFRGANDMETLIRVREGKWEWYDEEWWSRFSLESRDFISKLLILNWRERLDVDSALAHPWLSLADKIYKDEYIISTDRLRGYYNLYKEWTSNASCRTWFRRRPLEGAFTHPSKMVYPPGEIYTPEGTPDRDSMPHDRKPSPWDTKFKQWDHPDWEVSAKSESHYQNGPDTYLLQLRDTQFPVRLREYMKVACNRSPAYNLSVHDAYDPRTPIIRERRRFTDVMDEEIDDERKERINQYGTESYTIRRLRHELGTRLDSYAEAQAFMESKKDGHLPFFREKPQVLPIREGEPAQLSCYAVGDPKPVIQWFKNDMVIAEGQRIKIVEDDQGRSTLTFDPAMHHDIGFYKVVARNKVGQTVARTRIVEATIPDAPDSPTATEVSDTEVLLRWKQPKYDGNSPVVCYSLQYKEGDSVEWKTVAENIDHEFFVIKDLAPNTSYQFRLSSRNRIGWSDKGIPTNLIKTKESGAQKVQVTKAMKHLQQITESGQEIVLDEDKPKLDYGTEENPPEWGTTEAFTERYSFVSELWRGKFSIVVKGIDKKDDSVVVAKILECRPETEVQVQREFECLRRLRHERISNLLAAYQTPGTPVAALILEKLQGADILTYLSSRHDYTEQMVATIITQILDGLQYLHWRGYCHLDLQPDNVVMASVRSIQVKLVDFGSAHKVTKLGTSVPQVGDLEYKAPEIINDEPAYPQTDIWSVGVLAYILLSGTSPFRGSDDAETKQNISFVRYRFEHLYKELTQEATRFLMFVFKKVPLKRPTAEECYEHRWLHHTDFMQRKRERAVFLGNRLKEFSEAYHERKSREASEADTVTAAFGSVAPRHLTRSNSIQDELQTNFSAQ